MKFDSLDSTNSFAESLITKTGPPEGTAIIADYQTDGKGQFGRKWLSEAGQNLTFSLILYPKFLLPEEGFLLNVLVSLSLVEVLDLQNIAGSSIKWPNDIVYDEGKLGGIIIKTSIQKKAIQSAVIGIGLNVNQIKFPNDTGNPVSMKSIVGQDFIRDDVFSKICRQIEDNYILLLNGDKKPLLDKYNFRLKSRGKDVMAILLDEKTIRGRLKRIDMDGKIVLTIEGKEKTFCYPDIRLLTKR